ncbi:MAG TPA: 2-dehydropantoate 2-reductase N-terminal domain-containing protein, partial [Acetobacteraceae bacterium]|nr:2-dehydropantoate 2-reductase N-terminal domain-containing protein [Acetobacteraceae bacterium]
MKVTIIGAGAIGGLAGSHMSRAGHDVLLVDRWAEHVRAMNENGMYIDGIRGEMRFPVKATMPDRLEGPLECVMIATKSQDTESAARLVIPLLGPDGFIVSYQNGFNEPLIADLLKQAGKGGMERVIGCIPNYGGALVDPGYLEFVHEGKIELGEMDAADTERLRTVSAMLESLTKVVVSKNIWGQIWAKQVYACQIIFSALVDA